MAEKKHKVVLEIGGNVAASLNRSFALVTGNTKKLGASLKGLNSQAKELREKISKGVGGGALAAELAKIEKQAKRTRSAIEGIGKIKGLNFGSKLGNVGSSALLAGGAGIAGALGMGALFKTQFLDVAAQFESFKTVLTTIEGSSAKAEKSFAWISDFAAKTPYDLAGVTESFVRLKAYGMDPVKNDLMKTLGDTAAAMGKPVMQAVEAISDAMTGENERLKEFGIKASKKNGEIIYSYTDKSGRAMKKKVNADSREAIQMALQAIWNEKYAGAMDKLSGTWGGMMSNVGDQWSRFANLVMTSGPFEKMKGRLGAFLETLDKMAEDGTLKKYAEEVGKEISKVIDSLGWLVDKARDFAPKFMKAIEPFGGLKTVLLGIAAIPLIPLASSVFTLGAAVVMALPSLWSIGLALGAAAIAGGPLTLALVGLAGIIGAIIAYWPQWSSFWEEVGWYSQSLWELVASLGTAEFWVSAWEKMTAAVKSVWAGVQELGRAISEGLGGDFTRLTGIVDAWSANIIQKIQLIKEQIRSTSFAGSFSMGGIATMVTKAVAPHISGEREKGGPVDAGKRYLVGERGPELFTPDRSGQIIPNGGRNRTDARTYNITINAAPGMDLQELAALVMAKLDGRQAALASGSLYD